MLLNEIKYDLASSGLLKSGSLTISIKGIPALFISNKLYEDSPPSWLCDNYARLINSRNLRGKNLEKKVIWKKELSFSNLGVRLQNMKELSQRSKQNLL